MALLPDVRFEVLLPDGGIVAGHGASGILVVTAAEAIPRAESLEVELVSTVVYRRPALVEKVLFRARRRVALPGGILAGVYRFPFSLETPPGLPPSFHDPYLTIRHEVRVRMDVAWARDPTVDAYPKVHLPPRAGTRTPARYRVVLEGAELELGLDATVLGMGEPITGHVRLLGGSLEPFQGVQIEIASERTSAVAGHWRRPHASAVIADEALRGGEPVRFELPGVDTPSFRSDVVDHAVKVGVRPHGAFMTFRTATTLLPLEVLPRGSVIAGEGIQRRFARVAAATGLREGTGGILVEGEPGGMRLQVRAAGTAFVAELAYPQNALGKPIVLRTEGERADEDDVVELVRRAIERAGQLVAEVRQIPFPASVPEDAARAWRAYADATGAFLVPWLPSLDGLILRRVLATQDERTFTVSITTTWEGQTARDRITVQLGSSRLPERVMALLANGIFPEGLAALRETFTAIHASSTGALLVLDRDAWSSDPRALVPKLEAVIDWVMRERGEQRSGSPYR